MGSGIQLLLPTRFGGNKMKRKSLLLVAFFMCLYIVPMILAPWSASFAILAEQNMNKDFALSTEYSPHEQSITLFDETIPDDVLYFPDFTSL